MERSFNVIQSVRNAILSLVERQSCVSKLQSAICVMREEDGFEPQGVEQGDGIASLKDMGKPR
jgi:hypothetical protein